jgi:hypothetical protein
MNNGVRFVPSGPVLALAERARANGITVHVLDCFARPDINNDHALYSALAESFAFPEYFGFNMDALWDLLTDASWWNGSGHELYLAIPPTSPLVRGLDRLLAVFSEVCHFYAQKGKHFCVYVVDGPIARSRTVLW